MKKKVLLAILLGSACLAATGCSSKSTETEKKAQTEAATEVKTEAATEAKTETQTEASTEAQTEAAESSATAETEIETKTGAADETETETEAASENATEALSEAADAAEAEAEEEELGERPDYKALDYVTLGEYKGLQVTVAPVQEVTDEDVKATEEAAIKNAELYEERTEGTVKEGDIVNIDYEGKKDGVAFDGGTAQGYNLEIGSGTFIDGFEEGLIGVKVGDTVDLDLTFPENYQSEDLAGQAVVFTVKVNAIEVVPEKITDDMANQLSSGEYTTAEEYEQSVRDSLAANYQKTYENSIYNDLMTQLYNLCTINEYPQDLVDYGKASMKKTYTSYAEAYGMSFTDFISGYFGMDEETFDSTCEEYVKQTLQQELILKAIAEQEEFTVSDEDYQTGCERYMENQGYSSVEDLEEAYGEATIRMSVLLDKTLDFVRDNAIITESEKTEAETEASTEEVTEAAETGASTEAATEAETEAATEAAETETETDAE